ncbi:hypothetical protein [Arthrospira platensis]|jgi:hypothetical protein|nr:hypothetical protein [Arthrospira platensis]AMW29034.1 hypothetical protein AP285_14785 [Arthrospira platensis YZ]KDR55005.1 hypothetical protein APPUASWS_024585 [Arthrospira platensis str. Paraca]MBD2571615.1 hypothetical protein [Arthrospira platensis FACHB-971]MBD2708655.1 hypothetical protein [Arthrospira platensis FACHB-835]
MIRSVDQNIRKPLMAVCATHRRSPIIKPGKYIQLSPIKDGEKFKEFVAVNGDRLAEDNTQAIGILPLVLR